MNPDQILAQTDLIRIGAFRCPPTHAAFHDSGPAQNYCFVFPRTAVEIEHEHARPFAANPNVVTFYNKKQAYRRRAISREGDRCDWFGVHPDIVRDVVRSFDPTVDAHPEQPFRLTRGWGDASTYLLQRQVFNRALRADAADSLALEEAVIYLLERVVRSAYSGAAVVQSQRIVPRQRDIVHQVELLLSQRWGEPFGLREIAGACDTSVYHLCRLFRRATGTTLHRYRQKLHVRGSLEKITDSRRSLVDIALDAGFSSHSHFTSTFHREFAHTPSQVRAIS